MVTATVMTDDVPAHSISTFTPTARDEPGPIIGMNDLVLESPEGAVNGTQVLMEQPTGADNQNWVVGLDGQLFNPATSKCLDIQTMDELGNVVAPPADGTLVNVNGCNGFNTQEWRHDDNVVNGATSGGVIGNLFFSGGENICLAIVDPTSEAGSPLEVTDCTGGSDQMWRIPFFSD
ncbi:RICIN domain-containing protein [Rhodococcus sp. WMMA185]|uniref:RICIN domain-containing protein n=1 Tax=Rhodococcus sp. WMMA185 TaxID=679318 RepID=UPI0012F49F21|nr:hypothetical protein [Rhodococcus sp. WMMA185]